jgi:putative ABC transport system substrate-binding protein
MNRRRFVATAAGALLASTPPALWAQTGERTRVIGYTSIQPPAEPGRYDVYQRALLGTLREHGFVEGKNLSLMRRYSQGDAQKYRGFMEEFVKARVDLIVAVDSAAALAAKNASSTIPVVMAVVSNPERQGLVASLAKPGGNVTGMSQVGVDFSAKLLQILKEAVPGVSRVAVLHNPDNSGSLAALKEADIPGAAALGLGVVSLEVRRATDLEQAFSKALQERANGVYAHLAMWAYRGQIADFALRRRLPLIVGAREWSDQGAMMSYGVDLVDHYRRVGQYVAKILKGTPPGEIPVEQPQKFELIVNLKTAKAIGHSIPRSILLRADRVIE